MYVPSRLFMPRADDVADGFETTKPGPYFQAKVFRSQGKFGRIGGRMRAHYVLQKRDTGSATSSAQSKVAAPSDGSSEGEVPAEDIQNDSMYLCEGLTKHFEIHLHLYTASSQTSLNYKAV